MNLKNLVQAQAGLINQRRDGSDTLCRQAYALLAESESQGFEDKELLKEAMRLFIQAIRQQRQNPEPYLGLIYLFFLIGEESQANLYLDIVFKLAPQHQEAMALKRFMQAKPPETEQILHLNWEGETLRPEKIFDKLELSLFYVLKDLRSQPLPIAGLNQSAKIAGYIQQIENWLSQFEAGLQQLDAIYDTSSLIRRLQPVEARLVLLKQIGANSETINTLAERLNTMLLKSRKLYQAIGSGQKADVENSLEVLLDDFDKNSQLLFELLDKCVELSEITRTYEALKAIIEQIYETIDA